MTKYHRKKGVFGQGKNNKRFMENNNNYVQYNADVAHQYMTKIVTQINYQNHHFMVHIKNCTG